MSRHKILACLCCLGFTALVSIADAGVINYQGSMKQGSGNGARWSYVHAATNSEMTPLGGWTQKASGALHFEMLGNEFNFEFDDKDDNGFDEGDEVRLKDIVVSLKEYSGLGSANLTLNGTLVVGAETPDGTGPEPLSPLRENHDFTNFLSSDNSGLSYEIDILNSTSTFSETDLLSGIAYFQEAFFAGPFNGIKMVNNELTFALWGDSRSSSGNTGMLNGDLGTPLGFDIFVEGASPSGVRNNPTPEPGSLVIFFGLALTALAPRRQRRSA